MHINAQTRLVTLLGDPVAHSHSPLIHNTAFGAQDVNAVYVATQVAPADLAAAVEGLRALRFRGANVTIPHKQAVHPLLDTCTARAEAVGAVNTIVCRDDGTLHGDNTDVPGFLAPLQSLPERDWLRGTEMLIFGAGGAARAVAYALLDAFRPTRLTLAARTPAKAERLTADLAPHDARSALRIVPMGAASSAAQASALIVNATPVGMHPEPERTPWPHPTDFAPEQIVYDLVYNPTETRLLREAAARGATTLGGLEMLIQQAAAAYAQWTDQAMPVDTVRAALHNHVFTAG